MSDQMMALLRAETREILLAAAQVIEVNGHFKGDYLDFDEIERARWEEGAELAWSDCPVCAYGAINIAACGQPNRLSDVGELAAAAFAGHLGITPSGIGIWNDAPERTEAEVITSLRECADSEEVSA